MWFQKFGHRAKIDGKTEIGEKNDGNSEMLPPCAPRYNVTNKPWAYAALKQGIFLSLVYVK